MNSNIYKISIEGGSAQQVTFWDSHNDTPAWSPDGKWIAFTSDQGGSGKIWLVSSEGGPPHQFVESELGNSCEIAWAPGANILYQRPGNRNFDILNPSTGEARPLANDDSVGWMGSACNSPNGNKVAVHWNRKPKGIWVISLDGYSETMMYGDANRQYWPLGCWTDGNCIYFSEPSEEVRKILKVPVTGGEPRSVANLPFDKIEYLSVTADGKKSVFTVRERKSDVWLAEDFDRYIP